MVLHRIPPGFEQLLGQHLKQTRGKTTFELDAFDFPDQSVEIRFPDDSNVLFKYAFHLVDEQRALLAVFTEHCGYHVFPATDAVLSIRESGST